MIQNESRDSPAVMCLCLQRRCVRHNANYVPYARANAHLSALLYLFRESLSSLSIAMGYRDSARGTRCLFYLDHNVTATSSGLHAP